eukprot:scaffold46682_cov19-Tisochrysis_lutea.AAC.1
MLCLGHHGMLKSCSWSSAAQFRCMYVMSRFCLKALLGACCWSRAALEGIQCQVHSCSSVHVLALTASELQLPLPYSRADVDVAAAVAGDNDDDGCGDACCMRLLPPPRAYACTAGGGPVTRLYQGSHRCTRTFSSCEPSEAKLAAYNLRCRRLRCWGWAC